MAKTYTADDLAKRAFAISIAGISIWIAVVFLFIL
jgi:hypothetical protein